MIDRRFPAQLFNLLPPRRRKSMPTSLFTRGANLDLGLEWVRRDKRQPETPFSSQTDCGRPLLAQEIKAEPAAARGRSGARARDQWPQRTRCRRCASQQCCCANQRAKTICAQCRVHASALWLAHFAQSGARALRKVRALSN